MHSMLKKQINMINATNFVLSQLHYSVTQYSTIDIEVLRVLIFFFFLNTPINTHYFAALIKIL